ncbi:MAG: hypothetical protein ACKVP1_13865, partial [Burkholderiaceae bacterium]
LELHCRQKALQAQVPTTAIGALRGNNKILIHSLSTILNSGYLDNLCAGCGSNPKPGNLSHMVD